MADLISVQEPARRPLPTTDTLDLLANQRRRKVLTTLREQTGGVTKQDLATIVASRERGTELHEVTAEQQQAVLTSLHHKHLPKLREHALVDVDDEGRISPTDTTVLTGNTVVSVALDLSADDEAKDVTFEALASEVRRTLIETLRSEGEGTVRRLAAAVATNNGLSRSDAVVALTHTHLPKLDEHEVIEFDHENEHVIYRGLPLPSEAMLELTAEPSDDLRPSFAQ